MDSAAHVETSATLLERERELAELDVALAEAGQGRGRVVPHEAPAGLARRRTSAIRSSS